MNLLITWRVLFPNTVPLSLSRHSTSVSSSERVAVPLSVDVKEGPSVPNPIPGVAVKAFPGPHVAVPPLTVPCDRIHSLLPSTLQRVIPFLTPVTVQVKLKVSLGQVAEGAVNCAETSPGDNKYVEHPLHLSCWISTTTSCYARIAFSYSIQSSESKWLFSRVDPATPDS